MAKTLMVEETLKRVQQLTEELRALRGAIRDHVFAVEETTASRRFNKSRECLETMAQFKAIIDDIRHDAWLYLEAVAEQPISGHDRQRRLLARATEILGAVSQRPPLPGLAPATGEGYFVDRLLHLIDRVDPKPPVSKEALHHRK